MLNRPTLAPGRRTLPVAVAAAGRSIATPARAQGRPVLGDDDKPILPDELGLLRGQLARLAELEIRRGVHGGPRARDVLLVELLASTGLRVSEAVRLEVRDVELSGRAPYVRIRGGKARERKAVDTVPVPWPLVRPLREFMARTHDRDAVFSAARSDRAMTRGEAWHTIKRAMRAAGLRSCLNVHSLRHFYISAAGRQPGATPQLVAKLARLRDVRLVGRYFHASAADLHRIANLVRMPRARQAARRAPAPARG